MTAANNGNVIKTAYLHFCHFPTLAALHSTVIPAAAESCKAAVSRWGSSRKLKRETARNRNFTILKQTKALDQHIKKLFKPLFYFDDVSMRHFHFWSAP